MCFRKKDQLNLRAMHLQENYEQRSILSQMLFKMIILQHRCFPVSIMKFLHRTSMMVASV